MNERYNQKIESEDEKKEKQFLQYIQDNGCTAKELRQAYYVLCGVDVGGGGVSVRKIEGEMTKMANSHFPLNRFSKVISSLEEWEDSIQMYHDFVSSMAISDNEKNMLTSIANRKRTGELECYIDGNLVARFVIEKINSEAGAAYALRHKLTEVLTEANPHNSETMKLSFLFEEK